LETSADLLAAQDRLNQAQDVLDRSVIIAPVSGEVLNMSFATIGGVVGSGETLMEIVPDIGEVTASVQISAIYSGRSRTLLDYLFEPLGESLFKGLRTG